MKLPPPPKWDKAIDGLDDEYFRRQQKKHLLPLGTVIPRKGQVWEAVRDCDVHFAAYFNTQWPQCGKARLQRGERARTEVVDIARLPAWVNFQPVRYHELHANIVPEELRRTPGHTYYFLHVPLVESYWFGPEETTFFNEAFRLIEDVA